MLRVIILLSSIGCLYYSLPLIFQHVHHLGTWLLVTLGMIFLLYAIYMPKIQQKLLCYKAVKTVHHLLWAGFMLWIVSVVLFFYTLNQHISMQRMPSQPINTIMILGGGIHNNQPTEILKMRLDEAAKLFQRYPNSRVIVSGGKTATQQFSGAQIMKNYLVKHGNISASQILLEDQSTSTELNFKYTKTVLKQHHIPIHQPIAVVSSDFHLPRSQAIARRQGYQHLIMIAAPTPIEERYAIWLREYFAYFSGFVLNEY